MTRDDVIKACYEIPGQTWPTELGWLYDTLASSMTHAEVGVYCGRSLVASAGGMQQGARIFGVDNGSLGAAGWVDDVRRSTIDRLVNKVVSVQMVKLPSVAAARSVEASLSGVKLDSVFIDADHHYAECIADIEAWSSLVRPGGIVCGHDYWPAHPGVMDAVNRFFGEDFSVFANTRIWYSRIKS